MKTRHESFPGTEWPASYLCSELPDGIGGNTCHLAVDAEGSPPGASLDLFRRARKALSFAEALAEQPIDASSWDAPRRQSRYRRSYGECLAMEGRPYPLAKNLTLRPDPALTLTDLDCATTLFCPSVLLPSAKALADQRREDACGYG